MSPGMRLPGTGMELSELFDGLESEWTRGDIGNRAAALTYFGVLAIFPFLLFLVALASVIISPSDAAALTNQLRSVAPPAVADILGGRIESLAHHESPALLTVGALGAIWSASSGVASLMEALDRAYDVEETRPFWKVRGIAVLTTIAAAILAVIAAILEVATPAVAHVLSDPLGTVVQYLGYPVGLLFMIGSLVLLYWALPNVKQRVVRILPGAIFAALLWVGVSVAFSIYVRYFGNFEAAYGTLGGVAILLLWMYLSSIAVLLGAAMTAVVEKHARHGAPPRLRGPAPAPKKPPTTTPTEPPRAERVELPSPDGEPAPAPH